MEEEIGAQLFYRTKRHVELTEAGKIFLAEARLILDHVGQAVRTVQRAGQGEVGRLVIGFVMSATCSVLPEILRVFRERFPQVELVLKETTTGRGLTALQEQRLHLCFLRLPISDESLNFETVLREPLILALPAGHRLAGQATVSLKALAAEPFVLFPRDQGQNFYDQIVSFCHQAGFSPRVTQEATQLQTILSLVAAGIGVALIPASVKSLRRDGIVYKALHGRTPKTGIALAWRKDYAPPVLDNFLKVAKSFKPGRTTPTPAGR